MQCGQHVCASRGMRAAGRARASDGRGPYWCKCASATQRTRGGVRMRPRDAHFEHHGASQELPLVALSRPAFWDSWAKLQEPLASCACRCLESWRAHSRSHSGVLCGLCGATVAQRESERVPEAGPAGSARARHVSGRRAAGQADSAQSAARRPWRRTQPRRRWTSSRRARGATRPSGTWLRSSGSAPARPPGRTSPRSTRRARSGLAKWCAVGTRVPSPRARPAADAVP